MVNDVPLWGRKLQCRKCPAMLAGKTSHVLITDKDGRLWADVRLRFAPAVAEGRLTARRGN